MSHSTRTRIGVLVTAVAAIGAAVAGKWATQPLEAADDAQSPTATSAPAATADPAGTGEPSASDAANPAAPVAVDGDAIDYRYGVIQVRLELAADGEILAATTLRYPADGTSGEINAEALPQLEQALLASQSAEVDTISGATYTTDAYLASAQSALDRSGLR